MVKNLDQSLKYAKNFQEWQMLIRSLESERKELGTQLAMAYQARNPQAVSRFNQRLANILDLIKKVDLHFQGEAGHLPSPVKDLSWEGWEIQVFLRGLSHYWCDLQDYKEARLANQTGARTKALARLSENVMYFQCQLQELLG